MADFDFENPTFDPDGPGVDDDYSLDLPDAIMDPLPPRVQEEHNMSGDNIQTLRGEIREAELEAQKKRLVDTFYKEVNRAYGLRPDSIDYDQFRIDDDGKTLYLWIAPLRKHSSRRIKPSRATLITSNSRTSPV